MRSATVTRVGKREYVGLKKGKLEMAAKMLAAGELVEEVVAYTGLGKAVVGKIAKVKE